MARQRRSLLPPVTEEAVCQRPDAIRRTAHGWAWKCAYCGQFASSETQAGRYVCRSHGGVTARQRSPEARLAAREAGKPDPRPPGRPLETGFYSRKPGVRLDELVVQYQASQLDLDCTDEDMLYLRAYQQERMELAPQLMSLSGALERAQLVLEASSRPSGELTGDSAKCLRETRLLMKQVDQMTRRVEEGHERLIHLSKVRAETRVKNHAARQVEAFTLMVERLMIVLQEQLLPADLAALQARVARDLSELPAGLVDGSQRLKEW